MTLITGMTQHNSLQREYIHDFRCPAFHAPKLEGSMAGPLDENGCPKPFPPIEPWGECTCRCKGDCPACKPTRGIMYDDHEYLPINPAWE